MADYDQHRRIKFVPNEKTYPILNDSHFNRTIHIWPAEQFRGLGRICSSMRLGMVCRIDIASNKAKQACSVHTAAEKVFAILVSLLLEVNHGGG